MSENNEQVSGLSDELFKDKLLANEKINGTLYHKFYNYLVNSLNSGYAPIVAICGRYGGGKSMTGLEIARILHNEINVLAGDLKPKRQLCYNVLDFLTLIENSKRKAVLFDDAGVSLNSLDYRSDYNRAVVDTIATQRYRENIYIFILGKLYKLTKSIRDVIDCRLLISKSHGQPKAKITIFRPKYGKTTTRGENKKKIYLQNSYRPELPPETLRESYRDKEIKFKEDLIKDKIKELKEKEKDKEKKRKTVTA